MQNARGLTPDTLSGYGARIANFLVWCDTHAIAFPSVRLTDVDRFLDERRAAGWQSKTLAAQCQSLRMFFRYAGIVRNDGAIYQPRLHDLRSTFAVHRITSWIKQGKDLNRMLPGLIGLYRTSGTHFH